MLGNDKMTITALHERVENIIFSQLLRKGILIKPNILDDFVIFLNKNKRFLKYGFTKIFFKHRLPS